MIFAALAFCGFCFALGLGAGLLFGDLQCYQRQTAAELAEVTPLLQSDPAYKNLEPAPVSNGGIELVGAVKTRAEYERLNVELAKIVGKKRGEEIGSGVDYPNKYPPRSLSSKK